MGAVKQTAGTAGFTLIELLVVIMIMGILLSVSLVAQRSNQTYADDNERADDTASIARRLEQAYSNQETGAPSYPSTTELLADISSASGTMKNVNPDAYTAPGAPGPSVVPAASEARFPPSPEPTATTYVYQPLRHDGRLCTADPSTTSDSDNCVSFVLYYRAVMGNAIKTIMSIHQQ